LERKIESRKKKRKIESQRAGAAKACPKRILAKENPHQKCEPQPSLCVFSQSDRGPGEAQTKNKNKKNKTKQKKNNLGRKLLPAQRLGGQREAPEKGTLTKPIHIHLKRWGDCRRRERARMVGPVAVICRGAPPPPPFFFFWTLTPDIIGTKEKKKKKKTG
jgi:hypothetical protein